MNRFLRLEEGGSGPPEPWPFYNPKDFSDYDPSNVPPPPPGGGGYDSPNLEKYISHDSKEDVRSEQSYDDENVND